MKKCNAVSCFRPIIVIALIVALSGCERNSVSIPGSSKFDASTAVKEEITEWPDNIYTQAIIKPKTGAVDYYCWSLPVWDSHKVSGSKRDCKYIGFIGGADESAGITFEGKEERK